MKTKLATNTQPKINNRWANIFVIILAACFLSLLPGCRSPLEPQVVEGGTGTISLIINDGMKRTIMPSVRLGDFVQFRLDFTSNDSGNNGFSEIWTRECLADGTGTLEGVPLGTWNLRVSAFLAGGDVTDLETTAATGYANGINVSLDQVASANVMLDPIPGGEGIFAWDISFPVTVQTVRVEIREIDGDYVYHSSLFENDGGETQWDSSHNLPTGQYLVIFTLTLSGNQGHANLSEILHVYRNMVSQFGPETFTNLDFPVSLLSVMSRDWDGSSWGNTQIRYGHFGVLNINGVIDNNFNSIVSWFAVLLEGRAFPNTEAGLKALVDAALIGVASDDDDFTYAGNYPDRTAKENAIRGLVRDYGNYTDIERFEWNTDNTTVTVHIGGYSVSVHFRETPSGLPPSDDDDRLIDDGSATRTNQGTGVNEAATRIVDFAEYGLQNVRFVAENFQTQTATNRWHSIWLVLSSGDVIGVTGRRTPVAAPLTDRLAFGPGTRANMLAGGDAGGRAIRTNGGFAFGVGEGAPAMAALDEYIPGFRTTVSDSIATSNTYEIRVDINAAGTLSWAVSINGSEPFTGEMSVPTGTTVTEAHAWSHTNSTMTIPEWRLYNTSAPLVPPGNVVNITATVRANGLVDLTWPAASNAAEYVITIADGISETTILVSAPVHGDNRIHQISAGLVNGTNYIVSIVGRNFLDSSSVPASTTFTPTLPAVTGLAVTGGVGQATLDWDALEAATSFRVYRAPEANGETFIKVGTANAGATTFTDTGLAAGAFRWCVVSVNYAGASQSTPPEASATIAAVTTVPQGIPGNFTVQVGHASGLAVLTWQAVEFANAYDVRYRLTGDSWSNPIDVGNIFTHTFANLTNGQQYEFSVRARNQLGAAVDWAYFGPIEVNTPPLDIETGVWFETIFAYWTGAAESTFNVYVAPTGTTNWRWVNDPSEAVVGQTTWTNDHSYLARVVDAASNRWRVDVPGLAADNYQSYDLRFVELQNGSPTGRDETVRGLTPPPFDRQGFAFSETSLFGHTTGAYNRDGTLRDDAVVIYITPENTRTFANPWNATDGATGLFTSGRTVNRPGTNANAVSLRNATPLAIRIIGNPNLIFATRNNNQLDIVRTANVTIEGIGPNTLFDGFGLFIDRSSNIVVRNIHFRNWGSEDGILVQGAGGNPHTHGPFPDLDAIGNATPEGRVSINTWITHNRFTADDQNADGHVDYNNSSYFTQSYNIFTRNGRGGLAGNSTNSGFFRGTYHHNHYIDTNTRAPRLRASETHIFNNFYDYTSFSTNGYSIGAGHHASVIAEGNYFRNANAPFIISGQGHNNAGGSNTLTGDQLGFLITDLTTPENNPESTHGLHSEQRIFDLAATLVPNHLGNANHFDVNADQGLPRNDNNRGPGRAFGWTQYAGPQAWPMLVNVTSAEEARQRVLDYAGPMRQIKR